MFSMQSTTMKLPRNIEGPSSGSGGVPNCTMHVTHINIYGLRAPMGAVGLLSTNVMATVPCKPLARCYSTCAKSADIPTTQETAKTCQDIPAQIMLTYAEVVKSVNRQLPKQPQQLFRQEQLASTKLLASQVKPTCILNKFQQIYTQTIKSPKSSQSIQNSQCSWRRRGNQRHSNDESKKIIIPNSKCKQPNSYRNSHLNPKSCQSFLNRSQQCKICPNPLQTNIEPSFFNQNSMKTTNKTDEKCSKHQTNIQHPLSNHITQKVSTSCPPPQVTGSSQSSYRNSPCPQQFNSVNTKVPENWRRERRQRPRNRNKFWQTSPRVLSSNWRIPEPQMSVKKEEDEIHVEECPSESLEYLDRARGQSESSQASEDSWVVFERDSGCSYDSEVSSQPSDDTDSVTALDSETETESNNSGEESDSSPILADSGHNTDSDEERVLEVGDGPPVSLPPKIRLPPLKIVRRDFTAVNNAFDDDSDDDWIVFQSDTEDECSDTEDECDGADNGDNNTCNNPEKRTSLKTVRFASHDETCYLYDDDEYRAARCGEWEEIARDRARFRARVTAAAEVIAPVLTPEHRQRILRHLSLPS